MLAASAPPAAAAPPGAEPTERRWYGWQPLIVDGAAATLVIAGLSSSTQTGDAGQIVAYAGAGAYLLGGPITHWVHGHSERALGSLALRAALPATLALVGSAQSFCGRMEELCTLGGAALGALTAVVIDATLLGYEKVPVAARGVTSVGVSADRGSALIFAGGAF